MIIGITGATKVGKSTYMNDFIEKYNKYITPEETYRDIPDLDLYEKGTEASQGKIRDFMYDQAKEIWAKRDTNRKVIQDRTLLDNLACTMYLYSMGKISDQFLVESMTMTKEAMSWYHLIYFIPITKHDNIPVPEDIDHDFRTAFDVNLKTMYYAYEKRDALSQDIFPEKNCTAIEQIFGSPEERIGFASMILDEWGEVQGGMESGSLASAAPLYDSHGQEVSLNTIDNELKIEDFGSFEPVEEEENKKNIIEL